METKTKTNKKQKESRVKYRELSLNKKVAKNCRGNTVLSCWYNCEFQQQSIIYRKNSMRFAPSCLCWRSVKFIELILSSCLCFLHFNSSNATFPLQLFLFFLARCLCVCILCDVGMKNRKNNEETCEELPKTSIASSQPM